LLSGVKLSGALFFNAEFSAPWGVDSPGSAALAPGARHLVIYHFVLEGRGVAEIPSGPSVALEPGDVVVFPHGHRHLLANGAELENPEQALESIKKIKARDLTILRVGGGGETTRIICGFMTCDPYLGRPVLSGLPALFKVNIRTDPSGAWLENAILHLVDEAGSASTGSDALLAKLSEALFVDALRRFIAGLPEDETGWLAGARDEVVGRSLGLLHSRVSHPWTLAELAA
jgi:hypothetical protein